MFMTLLEVRTCLGCLLGRGGCSGMLSKINCRKEFENKGEARSTWMLALHWSGSEKCTYYRRGCQVSSQEEGGAGDMPQDNVL